MSAVGFHKVVSALPSELAANSVYYVRVGDGVTTYVTNSSGQIIAYAPNVPAHVHAITDVSGLQTALNAKASSTHSHAWADITGKPSTFAPSTHSHSEYLPVAGGTITGDLTVSGSFYVASGIGLGNVTGQYGSVQSIGATGGWSGYSIAGNMVFMSNGTNFGLYDDTNNKWALYGAHNAGVDLRYAGSIKLATVSGGVNVTGALTASGNVTAYSDERLKDNIRPIPGALDRICRIYGAVYEKDGRLDMGVIAQNVRPVFPEAVHGDDTDEEFLSVNYGALVGPLIEAVKELKSENDRLGSRVAALEKA